MKKLLLLILPVLLICTGCTFVKAENSQGGLMDKKILIAYFSWGGNTKSIAEKIHNSVGGDKYTIAEDMGKMAKGSKVLEPLVIYERGNSETDSMTIEQQHQKLKDAAEQRTKEVNGGEVK